MCLELMLNAANLSLVAFSRFNLTPNGLPNYNAQVLVFFIITVAAAEVAVGLAIIVALYPRATDHARRTTSTRSSSSAAPAAWTPTPTFPGLSFSRRSSARCSSSFSCANRAASSATVSVGAVCFSLLASIFVFFGPDSAKPNQIPWIDLGPVSACRSV